MKNTLTLLTAVVLMVFATTPQANAQTFGKIDPQNVTIVRDSFGIPHIFGKTDAEVAYGLAWANAEDAFDMVENLVCIGRGYMGRKDGKDGAKADFFVHAIGARDIVQARYEKETSAEFKKYLNGFVQGLNAYAAAHPEQVSVPKAFPITEIDVQVSYIAIMSLLCHAEGSLGDALDGKYDMVDVKYGQVKEKPVGSNAYAINSSKSADGKTMLCINPHMQMDGQLSFYEAHLHSDEGLNIEGPMFQGSTSLAMGVNNNLGWGMTWNHFDRVDVYKLKMNPKKKHQYEFDGEWVELEKRPVWLKVNLAKKGKFVLPVKKVTYWSKYGMTIKSDKSDNYYAIRFPGNMSVMTGQQLYEMNKATDLESFKKAINRQGLSLFNIVYADNKDNIYYLHHGTMPDRKDQTVDWSGIVPGNSSSCLWDCFVPYDSMQHVLNPSCGYVFNTNNTPYNATCEGQNFKKGSLPNYADLRPGDNMRAIRLKGFLDKTDNISFKQFKDFKFDVTFPTTGKFIESLAPLFNLSADKYPDLKEQIDILKKWNRIADIHEIAPTYIGLVVMGLFDNKSCDDACFISGFSTTEEEVAQILRAGSDSLRAYYGTVKVEWGTVNRSIRGSKDLPLRGFADMLSPCYPTKVKGAYKFKVKYGDTYIMFASFGKSGLERLEALQPQGNSLNPDSPHYNDQMELFSRQETRPLSLKKEEVMKKAEVVYHPK